MSRLVSPNGAETIRPLLLEGVALAEERKRAESLPRITVSSREKGDLIMLGIGGFTPLNGFMTHADWQGVCDGMKMPDRKSTRLNSSHMSESRMPSSA